MFPGNLQVTPAKNATCCRTEHTEEEMRTAMGKTRAMFTTKYGRDKTEVHGVHHV